MKKFIKNYSLSLTFFTFFLICWGLQAFFQYKHEQQEAKVHGEELTMTDYANSLAASTMENWQSEFLQLGSMVVFTGFLMHKGSPESKDSDQKMEKLLRRIEKKVDALA
jgi:hypothetical protein